MYYSRLRRDKFDSIIKRPESFPYSFKHLFTIHETGKNIRELLEIKDVPTLVVINKEGEIIYFGGLNTKKHILLDNAFNIIDNALRV